MTNKQTGCAMSMPMGLCIGTTASLGITALSIAMLANLLEKESVSWEAAGYGIMATLILSSFIGAKVSWLKIKHQKVIVSMMSGLLYYGILLSITALFFGGQYEAVGVTFLLVSAGCGSAVLLGNRVNRGARGKIRKHDVVKLYK